MDADDMFWLGIPRGLRSGEPAPRLELDRFEPLRSMVSGAVKKVTPEVVGKIQVPRSCGLRGTGSAGVLALGLNEGEGRK